MDLKGIGQGMIAAAFLLFIAVGSLVSFTGWVFKEGSLKSKTRIEPRIELIITNNQPDTLFVYEVK